MLETSVGWVDAALLQRQTLRRETAAGPLTTTQYFLDGVLVKCDQHLDVSQAALEAAGLSTL